MVGVANVAAATRLEVIGSNGGLMDCIAVAIAHSYRAQSWPATTAAVMIRLQVKLASIRQAGP